MARHTGDRIRMNISVNPHMDEHAAAQGLGTGSALTQPEIGIGFDWTAYGATRVSIRTADIPMNSENKIAYLP